MVSPADVLIIGGGPAGCAAARLLATWGHDVVLITRPDGASPAPLAESIPPSARKLWAVLGVQDAVDRAGFVRATGNTVWWGNESRVELFADGERGWQVTDLALARVLLDQARAAGARVEQRLVTEEEAAARPAAFRLDCSGRSGLLARPRGGRRYEPDLRTVAVVATWQSGGAWSASDDTHTLIESYTDGWAWSVPLSTEEDSRPASARRLLDERATARSRRSGPVGREGGHTADGIRHTGGGKRGTVRRRSLAVMVDPRITELARGQHARDVYLAEIAKTRQFAGMVDRAELASRPTGWDASMYASERYAGDDWLLVGDAGSFVDPLSSAGVMKALASGWLAAVVVNTGLSRPAMRSVALEFFHAREQEVYAGLARQTRLFLAQASAGHAHAFWSNRSSLLVEDAQDFHRDRLRGDLSIKYAFDQMRSAPAVQLNRAPDVRIEPRAAVSGREIVLERRLVSDRCPTGIRYICDVDVVTLVELASSYTQVPELFEACVRRSGPVALPDFLLALSTLVARGWVVVTE